MSGYGRFSSLNTARKVHCCGRLLNIILWKR